MLQIGKIFSYKKSEVKSTNNNNISNQRNKLENNNNNRTIPQQLLNVDTRQLQNVDINALPSSQYIDLPFKLPPTPLKGTYDNNTAKYAVILINNFLYKILNKFTIMNIPGFNDFSTKFYYYKDKNPIAFSRVSKDNSTLIICFRGSQTIYDFIIDSKYNYYNPINGIYPPQNNPETAVYTCPGFSSFYNGINKQILSDVSSINTLRRIFICGHSLGAALSFLLANELGQTYPGIVEVYGIAPPKTGDVPFANSVINNCNYTLSLINLADAVPSIITSYLFNKNKPNIPCSFSHVGPIAIFNNIQPNLQECHLINAYYDGVTNDINPTIVPVVNK